MNATDFAIFGFALLIATGLLLHSCEGRDQRLVESGKQGLVVDMQDKTIEAQNQQAEINNTAGIWLKNAEQIAKDAAKAFESEVSNAKSNELDLDVPLPLGVADGLRVRVTEAQHRICAGYTKASNPACPAPAKKDTATAKDVDGTQSGGMGQ